MTKEELEKRINEIEWDDFEMKTAQNNFLMMFGKRYLLSLTHQEVGLCLVYTSMVRSLM